MYMHGLARAIEAHSVRVLEDMAACSKCPPGANTHSEAYAHARYHGPRSKVVL